MNYRHGFHAGNFADVFKHALLTRLLLYLTRKETPFRVIDTHAGEGAYDLCADAAERTGEWRGGIARLADLSGADARSRELLAPYLDIVGPLGADGRPALYPGSPLIATHFLRAQDRAVFCELRPEAYDALQTRFARDKRVKTIHLDGYVGLSAFVPPKERRGLVLVDPPFEQRDETERMLKALLEAHRKWPTGIYALWRPIKDAAESRSLIGALRESGVKKILRLDLSVGGADLDTKLRSTGLIVVNPPFTFEEEARAICAFLEKRLAQGAGAKCEIEWVSGE
ncbi:23S rRNA (adenine(2030)-N(6))-methyltransferase RlmJ [Methylosinus sporium]|uniref:Ribosomal RNA large subunit methyltransferase J n=1 Tax=Methylosinus sporium TaxID=428 RepID=A0A549T8W9_METSR|nr:MULTISPECIES: 23S rRNA (adenine(2030)-N(6))-methyltransferase RlmJ [Methylosinus]MBU3887689.1 23S rRNA (adenine(2030)-N(6))-methyltransferase RlmJ [Methylosinus sp. KRF6]TRL38319.1 23S rRNA (adenine(2030)-N(6))-methyltransferase RlmJ [Methylosinus sporium]